MQIIAILSIYMDESGIHDAAEYCSVAGYWAAPRDWELLARKWDRIKRGTGHRDGFHAKRSFDRDHVKDKYREIVLALMAEFQARKKIVPFGTVVDCTAFRKLEKGERRYLTGGVIEPRGPRPKWTTSGAPSSPYFLAFLESVKIVGRKTPPKDRVSMWFEQQNKYEGLATQSFYRAKEIEEYKDKLHSITFMEKNKTVGLQAADLLAYCLTYWAIAAWSKGRRKLSGEMEAFLQTTSEEGRNEIHLYDSKALEEQLDGLAPEARKWMIDHPD